MDELDTLLKLDGARIEIFKDVNGLYCVEYAHCDIKKGDVLVADPGRGKTFEEACYNYWSRIRGKTLVFNAFTSRRKEVTVL